MAGRPLCSVCRQGLQQQFAECRPRYRLHRAFLSTSSGQLQKRSDSYQTPRPKETTARQNDSATSKKDIPPGRSSASIVRYLRNRAPSVTETYVAYGACEVLVRECGRVADYDIPEEQRKTQLVPDAERGIDLGIGKGWWYEELGLTPSFNTWAQVTFLHMWLLTVRLRRFPAAHAPAWHQHLTDHFFYKAEEKMIDLHGLSVRGVRNRYLKDLFVQWRGLTAAYDQGIVEGDALLATALWRNLCGADPNIDLVKLAMVTSYVRSVLKGLEGIQDDDIARAEVVFEDPSGEAGLVRQKSKLWDQPFDDSAQTPSSQSQER